MEYFQQVASQYGLGVAMVLYFLWKEFWPFIRDKFFPALAKKHDDDERRRVELIELEQRERQNQRQADREQWNQLIEFIRLNTQAVTAIQVTLSGVAQQLVNYQTETNRRFDRVDDRLPPSARPRTAKARQTTQSSDR